MALIDAGAGRYSQELRPGLNVHGELREKADFARIKNKVCVQDMRGAPGCKSFHLELKQARPCQAGNQKMLAKPKYRLLLFSAKTKSRLVVSDAAARALRRASDSDPGEGDLDAEPRWTLKSVDAPADGSCIRNGTPGRGSAPSLLIRCCSDGNHVVRKIDTSSFTRATRSTAREVNRQIALNLVREHQPISRADLAREMGVGRGMITGLVNTLISEGSIYEGATVDAARGRKPKMLHIRTRDRLVIAIDVRYSRTFLMLTDFEGTQIELETFPTIYSPSDLVSELAERIHRLCRAHRHVGDCEGIGLVVPGMVDPRSGRVLNSPQLGWHDVEIRESLEAATGLAVHVENAPIACALAQMWLGQRSNGHGNFVYVTVSEGVGAGVVVNGEVVRGNSNSAGEFGHIPISLDGPRCLCGARGCWESYTSNLTTLCRYLGKEPSPEVARALMQRGELTMVELIHRAQTGDTRATSALEETGRYLGIGLAMVVNALNPSRIFVGGEITAAWPLIESIIRAAVMERALTPSAAETPIIPEQMGGYPRLRGATALVAAPIFAAPQVA